MNRSFAIVSATLILGGVFAVSGRGQMTKAGDLKIEPYLFESAKGDKVDAEFGRLTVPENRKDPTGKTIEIAFVRFKGTGAAQDVPTIYLAGGPGGSGIAAARGNRFPLFMAMREFGDVIALDQRGTGVSKPSLNCGEAFDFPAEKPGNPGELIEKARAKSQACVQKLRSQGIDLSSYNTVENAEDIESLRVAIGARKISLWGISYGTHLALAYLKLHPESVNRAVLAGVNGLDDRRKLPSDAQDVLVRVAALVKADRELNEQIPDFLKLAKDVFDGLEKQPVTVAVSDPRTKEKVRVGISKVDLQFLTAQGLGNIQFIRSVPSMFYAMSKGNWEPFALQLLAFRRSPMPSAMYFSMDCASGGSKQRYEKIEQEEGRTLLGNAFNLMIADSCVAWNVNDLGDAFRRPVKSEVPTLFISGTLDGRTPPARAEDVRKGFTNSTHLIVENASHDDDLFLSTPLIKETIIGFMTGAKLERTITTKTDRPIGFVKPEPQK